MTEHADQRVAAIRCLRERLKLQAICSGQRFRLTAVGQRRVFELTANQKVEGAAGNLVHPEPEPVAPVEATAKDVIVLGQGHALAARVEIDRLRPSRCKHGAGFEPGRDQRKGLREAAPAAGAWPLPAPEGSRSHPESGCILNRLPRNPRYFSVNSWMIVNISYDRYLSSRTVVDFGSCEVFSMVFV